jgi:hypothetical protein
MKNILEIILENKRTRFDDFFNLDRKPDYPGVILDDLKKNHDKMITNLKFAKEHHKNDDDSIYEELSKANHYILKNIKYVSELESTLDDYNSAYNDLIGLLTNIIVSEDLDLTKYSSLSDEEWRKIRRSKRIDDFLK